MARWQDVVDAAPEFAQAVLVRFDAYRHKTLASLRADGSPRISGIEATFAQGELWLGMMPGSRKAEDLRRDGRLALHSGSADPPEDAGAWAGDAKLSGIAEEITDPDRIRSVGAAMAAASGDAGSAQDQTPPPMHLFRVDLTEVVLTCVGEPADHLVIEWWREGEELQRLERR